ncbi:MAG: hypothetical protein HOF09_01160 [Candidatus Thioglobus sp.]|nr:hypothetical protein [Candidatus Thioglobus sp.]
MKRLMIGATLLLSLVANAEDGFDDDGFDTEPVVIAVDHAPEAKGLLYGSFDIEAHYNVNNDQDLSSLKSLVDVIGEYKLDNGNKIKGNLQGYHDFIYDLDGSNYIATPDGYENEINLNELTLEGSLNSKLDFKVGRQIVVWGKSDSIRITDVLNPLDNRTPGLVDIKNLRLGRTMSKLDYYVDEYNFSAIALHENRFTKNPAQYSDFKSTPDKATNTPDDSLDNSGIALSLTGAFEGYDMGLYFADTYVDKAYLKGDILQYDNKSKMVGAAYNQVIDSFLFKAEVAHFDQIKYNIDANTTVDSARTDVLLGLEYNGITDGSIGYEISQREIHDYISSINSALNGYKREKEVQQVIRFNQAYFNQTLDLSVVLSAIGSSAQDGGSARVTLDYAVDDQVSVSGGIIDYIGGDNPIIDSYQENDRLFVKLSHTF